MSTAVYLVTESFLKIGTVGAVFTLNWFLSILPTLVGRFWWNSV